MYWKIKLFYIDLKWRWFYISFIKNEILIINEDISSKLEKIKCKYIEYSTLGTINLLKQR